MWPDRVSIPGPLAIASHALPTARLEAIYTKKGRCDGIHNAKLIWDGLLYKVDTVKIEILHIMSFKFNINY